MIRLISTHKTGENHGASGYFDVFLSKELIHYDPPYLIIYLIKLIVRYYNIYSHTPRLGTNLFDIVLMTFLLIFGPFNPTPSLDTSPTK